MEEEAKAKTKAKPKPKPKPKVMKYVVADKRRITAKQGLKNSGEVVTANDFERGEDALKALLRMEVIVEVEA
jgi:hypothetical protein